MIVNNESYITSMDIGRTYTQLNKNSNIITKHHTIECTSTIEYGCLKSHHVCNLTFNLIDT